MSFTHVLQQILPQASRFLGVFFVVMLVGYGILYYVDFVPEAPGEATTKAAVKAVDPEPALEPLESERVPEETPAAAPIVDSRDPYPVSISIDSLQREVTVANPTSSNVAELDKALLNGTVRHPDSADLTDPNGNILILGHSSYLKTVFNKNYQAFNGIQNLTWGDTIRLRSSDTEYIYRVDRVYQAKASLVTIPTRSNEPKLTLATCDVFGAKEDRFIVEASLVSKKAL